MTDPEHMELDDVIRQTLGELRGLSAVDIGAGSGEMTQRLARLGADVVGVEPNAAQVEQARTESGAIRYVVAPAEATGLDDQAFDLALFSLSLHHVEDMHAGLDEAHRITRQNGHIAVIEPVAPDAIYPVMHFIDDESEVYAEAETALADLVSSRRLRLEQTLRFAAKYRVESPEAMIDDLITVDSGRRLADGDRKAFEHAFLKAHGSDEVGGYIPYWSRIDVFRRL